MFLRLVLAPTVAASAMLSTASAATITDGKLPIYPNVTVYTCDDRFIGVQSKGAGSYIMVIPGASTAKNLYK